jgi:hypothetical protein
VRILAIILVAASTSAAADPVTDLLDSDEPADDAGVATLRGVVARTTEPPDRVVIANVKLGEALRRRACPVKDAGALCVERIPEPHGKPTRCGHDDRVAPIARNAKLADEASAAFRRAIKEADDHASRVGDRARHYYHRARLAEIDRDLDAYLARTLPLLDFDAKHAAASNIQLRAWFDGREAAGNALATRYTSLLDTSDAPTTVAVLFRLAEITASFANELTTAPIPVAVLREDQDDLDRYCDALVVLEDPLESVVVDRYAQCLRRSIEIGWFSDDTSVCEWELGQRKPETWPTLIELHPAPSGSAPITEIAPPQ